MDNTKKHLIFYIKNWVYWLFFFLIGKLIFIFINYEKWGELPITSFLKALLVGLKLDISFTGYLMIIPALILLINSFSRFFLAYVFIQKYTFLITIILTILIIVDASIYVHWGTKLEASHFRFLRNPGLVLSSMRWYQIIFALLIMFTYARGMIFMYQKLIKTYHHHQSIKSLVLSLFFASSLFLPIRGGLDLYPKIQLGMPIGLGSVYFHSQAFANHISINVPWYLGFSLEHLQSNKGRKFFTKQKITNDLSLLKSTQGSTTSLLKTNRPNIVLIILESFTANAIEVLGGEKNITPNFNSLCKEGVLFSNFYACGDRSDKGNGGIFTGHPSFPEGSVLMQTNQLEKQKFFPLKLKKEGYKMAYYYGGSIDFFNFNVLLSSSGFEKIISKSNYKKEEILQKWGVPDHITFNRFLQDINQEQSPFFYSIFSLSSHAPFDIPAKMGFGSDTEDNSFRSSLYYTDKALGNFITEAKRQEWWSNTLCIILADHGVDYLNTIPRHDPKKNQIPMLWLGGALNKQDTIIANVGSQMDIPNTLLAQLKIPANNFMYGKDILNSGTQKYAYYATSHGVGLVTDSTKSFYDLFLDKEIYQENTLGRSILQSLYLENKK